VECIATEWSGEHFVQELRTVHLIIAVEYSVVGLESYGNPYVQHKQMQARHGNSLFKLTCLLGHLSLSVAAHRIL
jgi:hypothetical protein